MPRQGSISILIAAALLGSVGMAVAHPNADEGRLASLQDEVLRLKRANAGLGESLVAANQREKESADALARIRLRLEALGENLIDGGDDRLVDAVTNFEVTTRRLNELEQSALGLAGAVQGYLKTAVVADPDARAAVEVRLRELEARVGLRSLPRPQLDLGTLQHARVVSIDGDTGLLVMNAGDKAGALIGMVFRINRGDRQLAEAVVVETRRHIAGLLIQNLEDENNPVRLGDIAALKVE